MPSVSAASMLSQSSVYHRLYSTKPESLQQNEIGHVCHVTDHIVDVSFVTGLPPLFTALQVMDRSAKLLLEVAEHLSDNTVRTVAMQATKGVVKGQRVISTGSPIRVPVGGGTLGRIMNTFGEPIDNKGSLCTNIFRPIHVKQRIPWIENEEIPIMENDGNKIYDEGLKVDIRNHGDEEEKEKKIHILVTGIKVIDLVAPILKGGSILLSAGAGVENQTLAMELVHNISKAHGGLSVFAGIGERTQDACALYNKMFESGLIKLGDEQKESKCVLVYGQMNESPGARARVAYSGLSVAENFSNDGNDVLFYVDNMVNLAEANLEISSLIGPSAVGYQTTLSMDFKDLQKRIITNNTHQDSSNTKKGLITSLLLNPIPPYGPNIPPPIFAHTDSTLMMCPKLHGLGIFPAIDPLNSSSRILHSSTLGEKHFRVAFDVLRLLKKYKNLKKIIEVEGAENLGDDDKETIARARKVQLLMTQPFHVTEVSTGVPGKYVSLEETISSFEELLYTTKYDHLPEEAFKMVGGIEDAKKKGDLIKNGMADRPV